MGSISPADKHPASNDLKRVSTKIAKPSPRNAQGFTRRDAAGMIMPRQSKVPAQAGHTARPLRKGR
jgi:hypothetical protein